eukprot:GCRY01000871.1.p1 GENE.GCRY01000871.1~~GCRY01000871.1.p1  ORF type:complete len:561 (+),score=137.86 GCRY01000871.1:129-1685(+)
MVLLSAAVFTKTGKILLSRQFVAMSRSHIEGVLSAFPKLIALDSQHTYVDGDTVRYLYQPIDSLYVVLVTTKNSNVLHALSTLSLLTRIIPDYCKILDEMEVKTKAFELAFAFDEVISMGYSENLTVNQVRTLTAMDSMEERVFLAKKEMQLKKAQEEAKKKATEIKKQKMAMAKHGMGGGSMGGLGNTPMGGYSPSGYVHPPRVDSGASAVEPSRPAAPSSSYGKKAGLSLAGSKVGRTSTLLSEMQASGEIEDTAQTSTAKPTHAALAPAPLALPEGPIHLICSEKLKVSISADGGFEQLEVKGELGIKLTDPPVSTLAVAIAIDNALGYKFITHPNIDKALFQKESLLALRKPNQPFPAKESALGILKWALTSQDEDLLPMNVTAWASDDGPNTELTLHFDMPENAINLNAVQVAVPLPAGAVPSVLKCDGTYDITPTSLAWIIGAVTPAMGQGDFVFTLPACPHADLFPITVSFSSHSHMGPVQVRDVLNVLTKEPVKFSQNSVLNVESYTISQ